MTPRDLKSPKINDLFIYLKRLINKEITYELCRLP